MFKHKSFSPRYKGAIPPFKIIGNVYFVGCYPASSHLIDTGDGLILIDTGYTDTLFLLIDSIYRLGFRPEDIRYILNTHWHWDHTEGTAPLAHISGAKTLICEKDAENAKKYFEPDILLRDGDQIMLGNTTIDIIETPGHTRGTISPFFDVTENGKTYRVGMFGGAGANTLVPDHYDYEGCVEDYFRSINRLRQEKVDVFIGNHVWNNDTAVKGEIVRTTGENPFIDDTLFHKFLDHCEARAIRVQEKVKAEQEKAKAEQG